MHEFGGPRSLAIGGASMLSKQRHFKNLEGGSSLLEVLVAILVMSFGMLALGGMQAYAIAGQKNAANRAIAASLANELAEIIRLNPKGLADGQYDVAMMTNTQPPQPATCAFPNCNDSTTLAKSDLTAFQIRTRKQLPLGGIEVSRPGSSATQAHVWILWEEAGVMNVMRDNAGTMESTEKNSDNCSSNAKNLATLPRCFYIKVQL
jgi:type IV pilus assembly protein PilV